MRKVCIVGASGKLGQYMLQHALDRGYEVVGVCRDASVEKLDGFRRWKPFQKERVSGTAVSCGESNLGLHLAERVQPGSFDAHLSCEWYGRYVELGSASVGLNA